MWSAEYRNVSNEAVEEDPSWAALLDPQGRYVGDIHYLLAEKEPAFRERVAFVLACLNAGEAKREERAKAEAR